MIDEMRNTPRGSIPRARFLKLAAAGIAGLSLPLGLVRRATGQQQYSNPVEDPSINELFARSIVFDGVVSLTAQRGDETPDLQPRTVKRLTGIDFGNMTTRVQRLHLLSEQMQRRSAGAMTVLRFRDFSTARESGRFGGIHYVQQGFDEELRGSVEPIAVWKEQGLRAVQITYHDGLLGGGAGSDDMPLSELGRNVVRELNRLHMIVDVSHTGRRTTLDVAEHSAAPVTANHASAAGLTDHRRNKSDEELKAIAATGGLVGVTGIGRYILRDASRPATLDDFVAHVDYMVQMIGIDHVGISSDGYLDGTQVFDMDFSDRYINSYERWKHVAARLRSMGYSDVDLQKVLGLNLLRIYEEVMDP